MKTVLRKEEAWHLLPKQTREDLYALFPTPVDGEGPHDVEIHPLKTRYKPYIEEELRRWQEDLRDGKEAKKWREAAMQAGKDRSDGKWDDWKERQREVNWDRNNENLPDEKAGSEMEVDGAIQDDGTE